MSAASPVGFWVIAVAGSIALHGAIGMALYAMPMPETRKPSHTEIDIATLAAGGAQQLAVPENVAVIEAERPAIVVQPPASVLAAREDRAVSEAARLQPSEMLAAKASSGVEPVAASQNVIQPSEEKQAAATAIETASEAMPANPVEVLAEANAAKQTVAVATQPDLSADSISASTPVQPSDAAVIAAQSAVLPDRSTAATTDSPIASTAMESPVATSTAQSPIAATSLEAVGPQLSAIPQIAAEVPTAVEIVASMEPATPKIATGGTAANIVATTPSGASTSLPAVAEPARSATIAAGSGTRDATTPVVARPVVTSPSGNIAGNAVVAGSTRPVETSSPIAPAVVAPSQNNVSVAKEAQVAALLPRPDVLTDGSATDGATSGTLRVAEFLATHRGDDCLLALPASINPTQASIQAYTAAPETVGRLGAEYERLSGLKLKADMKTVSKDQCGALAFARSLAQYPNFPLRVTLDQSTIESGRELSGVVSGLRKDTLYLMVIDDEGKAKLVTSYAGQSAARMNFKEPMTLTSGPVSSVQLLVAIASDGPLRTVPTRPGLSAEEYFSRLATEIIAGNRSIAYGITSFVVQ
ncbi:hypothetical protein [Mesorhizobium sp. CN2-181]|uniref:hypothetical protein n=1 Tax=Mesorhizobium yinganensis TaxID=3157707 RepID=UPI0032B78FCB